MHAVGVALVLVSYDLARRGEGKFLLRREGGGGYELPLFSVGSAETPTEVAGRLLWYTAALSAKVRGAGWVDLVQHPLCEHPAGKLVVPYSAVIPVDRVAAPHHHWVPFAEAFSADFSDPHHKAILTGVAARL